MGHRSRRGWHHRHAKWRLSRHVRSDGNRSNRSRRLNSVAAASCQAVRIIRISLIEHLVQYFLRMPVASRGRSDPLFPRFRLLQQLSRRPSGNRRVRQLQTAPAFLHDRASYLTRRQERRLKRRSLQLRRPAFPRRSAAEPAFRRCSRSRSCGASSPREFPASAGC